MARKNVEAIQIVVPIGTRDVITQYAKDAGFAVLSDYIRSLIETDMNANNKEIDLTVDRGGYRLEPDSGEVKAEYGEPER